MHEEIKIHMLDIIKKDFRLITCTGIMMLLLVARDILGVDISDIIVTVICILSMSCLKYAQMVNYIFFMFPIMCGVPGYIISTAYILLVIKGPRLKIRQIFPLLIIVILEIINESYRSIEGLHTGMLSFLSFTAIFFYFLDEDKSNKYSVRKSLIYYGLGTVFVFIVIYTNMFREYGITTILSGMLRSGALGVEGNDVTHMRGHLALNANTIAYMSISVVSIFSVMIEKIQTKRIFYFSIIAVCLFSGILSFSRTFIAAAVLFYILLLLTTRGAKKIKLGTLFLIVAIAAMFFFGDTILTITDTFVGRAEESNFTTAGGRTVLFKLYNEAWLNDFKYILFGTGAVSYFPVLHIYNAMHCGLQQIWVCLGITGLLLYLIRGTIYLKRIYTGKIILYLPFISTLFFDQSIQFLSPYPLVLILLATMQLPKIVYENEYDLS